jgi:hypothetical protein
MSELWIGTELSKVTTIYNQYFNYIGPFIMNRVGSEVSLEFDRVDSDAVKYPTPYDKEVEKIIILKKVVIDLESKYRHLFVKVVREKKGYNTLSISPATV